MAKPERRSIHIRVDEDHHTLIKRTARATGQPVAAFIRAAAIAAAKAEQRREA